LRAPPVEAAIWTSGILGSRAAVGTGVGKLRVAEAREQRGVDHGVDDLVEHGAEPVLGLGRADVLVEGGAAELRQHDRLATVRADVEREDEPARPAPVKRRLGLDLGAVGLADVLDVAW
jgi:hypothetical protein